MQMRFYVEFRDTFDEKIRKSKVPKIVIFDRKSKTFSHFLFSTDFKKFNGSETYETYATSVHNYRKTFKFLTKIELKLNKIKPKMRIKQDVMVLQQYRLW